MGTIITVVVSLSVITIAGELVIGLIEEWEHKHPKLNYRKQWM